MNLLNSSFSVESFLIGQRESFPNNALLPVLFYRHLFSHETLLDATEVKEHLFNRRWFNFWRSGIFTHHHFHSNTHEAMVVMKGSTTLELGGPGGQLLKITEGDALLIPAGVAHKNLESETAVTCLGAYPEGRQYDLFYGYESVYNNAVKQIVRVPIPQKDPFVDEPDGIHLYWKENKT